MNENNIQENAANEIVEITEGDEDTVVFNIEEINESNESEPKKKDKKIKKPSKWSMLSKKTKTIIIVCSILVVLLIVGIILFLFVFKKDEEVKPEEPKNDEPIVIVEKENYRYEDGKLIFLDKSKNELGSYECENKDEELCYIAYYSDEDDFDTAKYVYEDGSSIESRSDIILNNYVLIYDSKNKENGSILLYDIKEEKELGTYVLAKEVKENSYILKNEKGKYGIISFDKDKTETIVDFQYDYLGVIPNKEKIVAEKSLSYYLLDMEGKEVTKSIPGEIKNFNNKYISVIVDKDYYLYDYKGKKVLDTGYDYIAFNADYVGAIDSKKMYLFDDELNILNMEGIKIKGSNYNTKVVFDENKVQKEKTEAFKLSTGKGIVRVEYDDEFIEINVYEGKLSSTLEYISYYEGVLYIYKDLEKQNLIGSYTCSNVNIIDSSTTELNNCMIAKETVLLDREKTAEKIGNLPIYNNRYVFISDTESVKTKENIILWDLKQNKKQATYTKVDAGFYDNTNQVNFVDTANTLIVAENTSNSLGLIRIEASTITGIIPFRDKNGANWINISIKYLKDNLLVKRDDGSYHLFEINGKELTENGVQSEIVDYNDNYVQVKNSNNKYVIYSMDGTIVKGEYIHIKLYDKYFVGINDNYKINSYDYKTGEAFNGMTEKEILYKDDLSKSYRVDTSGKISILDKDGKIVEEKNPIQNEEDER